MNNQYDLIVIGSGPGGYVAAIRAAQLGMHVAVVEKESLGGVCLNWGCIPTKALLKSAQVLTYAKNAQAYGIEIEGVAPNFQAIMDRSRKIAHTMNQGIHYLFKKNNITLLKGHGKILANRMVELTTLDGSNALYPTQHILLATGAKVSQLPGVPIDGSHVVGYRELLSLTKQPRTMVIIGGGSIGCEFAYFFNALGTNVVLVEYMPDILPREDCAISKQMNASLTKQGIKCYTSAKVTQVHSSSNHTVVSIQTKTKNIQITCDIVLSATGVQPNIENIGLEENNITLDQGKIAVDAYYKTSTPGVYAIGDIVQGPSLAHVASAEGIVCIEKIAGLHPDPIDYTNIPACTYTQPEVASVGYTEQLAKEAGYKLNVGTFPFSASGKAQAAGQSEGFVKVIFDANSGEWLGAHMIGHGVTETIAEVVVARKLETTAHEVQHSIHPHPTMSEAIFEAVAAAYGEVIHL